MSNVSRQGRVKVKMTGFNKKKNALFLSKHRSEDFNAKNHLKTYNSVI